MTREIDALYARYALAPQSAPDAAAAEHALAPLLAANLDGFVFRRELLNLAGQLQQAEADRDAARERCDRIERDAAAWAAKLEADIATLRRELTTERARLESDVARLLAARQGNEAQVRALADERTRWVDAQRRQDERIGALDGECARLATENGRLAAALAQQVEDSRRLAAEGARTAEANAGLAADLAQAAEVNAGLAVDLAQAAERHGVLAATLAATERRENEARATIAHLTQESAELRAATTAEIARLGAEIERLGAEIRQLTPHREALALLPEFLRNYLHRKALRARG